MKKIYAFISLFCMLTSAVGISALHPAKDKNGLCKVNKINGVEAYVMCEPLTEYQVIGSSKGGLKTTSLITGGLVNESINDKIAQFIKKAQKDHPVLDGVVYGAGKNIGAFTWVTKPAKDKRGLAQAQRVEGKYAFVCAEPEGDYRTLGSTSGGVKWKSALTGGIVNNSIEEDIAKYMHKAIQEHPTLDGIIYNSGKSVTAIEFESK